MCPQLRPLPVRLPSHTARQQSVERPLLRCRFRAGYLVRGRAVGSQARAGAGVGQPRLPGNGNWVTPGPPPTNYVHARYRTRVFQSHPYLIGLPEAENVFEPWRVLQKYLNHALSVALTT